VNANLIGTPHTLLGAAIILPHDQSRLLHNGIVEYKPKTVVTMPVQVMGSDFDVYSKHNKRKIEDCPRHGCRVFAAVPTELTYDNVKSYLGKNITLRYTELENFV
jgi:hypothetical protein